MGFYELVGDCRIVLGRMYGTGRDAKGGLGNHASLLCPLDAGNYVANVVQAAENTGNVRTLFLLDLVHELANVVGNGIHSECVQATVKHVSLYSDLIERFAEGTDCIVGILACQQVDLLESAAIGLDAVEASHFDNYGSYACKLVFAGLKLAAALPHVSINETESDFLLHYVILKNMFDGRKDTKI